MEGRGWGLCRVLSSGSWRRVVLTFPPKNFHYQVRREIFIAWFNLRSWRSREYFRNVGELPVYTTSHPKGAVLVLTCGNPVPQPWGDTLMRSALHSALPKWTRCVRHGEIRSRYHQGDICRPHCQLTARSNADCLPFTCRLTVIPRRIENVDQGVCVCVCVCVQALREILRFGGLGKGRPKHVLYSDVNS
jgi:hypothetical protein